MRPLALVLGLLLALAVGACDSDGAETTTLIVGVTSDYRGGTDIDQLDVEMVVAGEVYRDSVLDVASGTFPAELAFEDVAAGAPLSLTLRGSLGGQLRVVRHMTTTAGGAGAQSLLRVHLEQLCDLIGSAGGGPMAPTCDEVSETCITGTCQSAAMPTSEQRPYDPDWASAKSDACKPGGPPEVIVGSGQSDYFSAEDYQIAQVEAGPQGGHHVWVAARLKNLARSGSITTVGGEIPSLGLSITPMKVIFTFDLGEGGYCKIFGLRFQLDVDGDDVQTMLGEAIEIQVTIEDADGQQASDSHWFTLSDDIL